jgi:hypothetical protein
VFVYKDSTNFRDAHTTLCQLDIFSCHH